MEYVQMTLNDWLEMKQKLKLELQGVKQSFVRIGYVLRKIDDQKLYEQDGYKSVTEFAKAEYGLEASTVSRFMSINKEYSIDGYSEHLREEYLEMGRSQLEEMLKLPDKDREMIRPETPRADIRELKHFNKTEPTAGVADDIEKLIEKFYEEHKEVLNTVFAEQMELEQKIELVNPGGNRSFKKGMYFMMMYEDNIKIKKFGADPTTLTWKEFFEITYNIFGEAADGANTWRNYFGEPEEPVGKEEVRGDSGDDARGELQKDATKGAAKSGAMHETGENNDREVEKGKRTSELSEKEKQKEEIAPAQKVEKSTVRTEENRISEEEQLEGQMTVEDYPELMPESPMDPPEDPKEIIERPFGTRKEYLDTLTEYGAADYMARVMRENTGPNNVLFPKAWEEWLMQKVDEKGRMYE